MIFKYSMLPDLWSGDLPVPIRSIYDKLGVRIAEFSGGVCVHVLIDGSGCQVAFRGGFDSYQAAYVLSILDHNNFRFDQSLSLELDVDDFNFRSKKYLDLKLISTSLAILIPSGELEKQIHQFRRYEKKDLAQAFGVSDDLLQMRLESSGYCYIRGHIH